VAISLYSAWLYELLGRAGLADAKVGAMPGIPHGDVYTRFTFQVRGRGSLEQLSRFLYDFYSVDHLHRIGTLMLKPITESEDVDIQFSIDALSLPNSPNMDELTRKAADRLAYEELEEYTRVIVRRSSFSPYTEPVLRLVDARPTYYTDETVAFTAAFTPSWGPAANGEVKYELGEAAPPGAQMDSDTGQFTFQPEGPGSFSFPVLASTNGQPSESANHTVSFNVTERPEPVVESAAPSFDSSKYAFLTGITEVAGRSEIWIFVRTSGRLLKLREGDELEVGTVKGLVTHIGERHVELETKAAKLVVALGDNLQEARRLPLGE
jgi:hypothetical protein